MISDNFIRYYFTISAPLCQIPVQACLFPGTYSIYFLRLNKFPQICYNYAFMQSIIKIKGIAIIFIF